MSLLTAPRSAEWIGCIDFGTALSKVALVRRKARAVLSREDVHALPIAMRAGVGAKHPLLLPSIVYINDDGRILFGDEAQIGALEGARRGREAFVSPKQYLSTRELQELEHPVSASIDPTGKYTAEDLLILFLAHLLAQAGAGAALAMPGKPSLPWPVPLRLARPAWKPARAQAAEEILQRLVLQAFVLVDELGSKLSDAGGVADDEAFKMVRRAQSDDRLDDPASFSKVFERDTRGSASVLEATAAAAGSIIDGRRRVVVVADIGGGTSDFGAFLTGFPGIDALGEIRGSSQVVAEAGDHLDQLLMNMVIEKAGIDLDTPAGKRLTLGLRTDGRSNKESLFRDGTLTVEVGEDTVMVTPEEFLADQEVKAFAWRLRLSFHETLALAVAYAEHFSLPVEILFTGGGHGLPMVRNLVNRPSVKWTYLTVTPEIPQGEVSEDFSAARPQLAVAIGGAVRDLPLTIAPRARR